jgi:hypothetical protein
VVPPSNKSIEDIVSEEESTDISHARELAAV